MLPPNKEAFEAYWHWVNERHKAYINRTAGNPPPWADDPILMDWRFCNVFRQLDKQSQYLIKEIIQPHLDAKPDILLFNIFMFRAFNWLDTYSLMGWQEPFDYEACVATLTPPYEARKKLMSSAYMIRGKEGYLKYVSILNALQNLWDNHKDKLLDVAIEQNSLQSVVEYICDSDLFGYSGFTAYQIGLDLTYSPILSRPTDINTWCSFGPGAKRGLLEMWPSLKQSEFLEAFKYLLNSQDSHRAKWVPEMNLQDIEFAVCELSKYMKIKRSGRGRLKFYGRSADLSVYNPNEGVA
jgi:hypothetical protein